MKMQTFDDIVQAIREAVGVQSADTNAMNKIKRLVNVYYLEEVIPFKRWWWLQKTVQIVQKAFFGQDNTCAVTQGSTTVTMDTAPAAGLGSFAGWKFSSTSSNTVYEVSTHTAGSATLTLTLAYQEEDDAEVGFRVWRDRVDLPADVKETIQVCHSERMRPLTAVGNQQMREFEAASPKAEESPMYYSVTEFVDPTTEDDRYRQMKLYPALSDRNIVLTVDYTRDDASELIDADDEPIMPIGDRIVLYYGACAEAWSVISRNEDMADRLRLKAQAKLARMAAEREDGMDTPKLRPRKEYLNAIRRSGLRGLGRRAWKWF